VFAQSLDLDCAALTIACDARSGGIAAAERTYLSLHSALSNSDRRGFHHRRFFTMLSSPEDSGDLDND
jgi:hypothetical protein